MVRKKIDKASPTNPYHYVIHCLSGKWKMTLLHEIHIFGKIKFNETLKYLPITEKVLSQQLKELIEDGIIQRKVDDTTYPPSTYYIMDQAGEELIPIIDQLCLWSLSQMKQKNIEIDEDFFRVHQDEKYVNEMAKILDADKLSALENGNPKERINGKR